MERKYCRSWARRLRQESIFRTELRSGDSSRASPNLQILEKAPLKKLHLLKMGAAVYKTFVKSERGKRSFRVLHSDACVFISVHEPADLGEKVKFDIRLRSSYNATVQCL